MTTIGDQTYQSYSGGSGAIELNGSLTTSDGNISLLGQGTSGVSLGLSGDTTINVGTAEFSIQKGSGAPSGGIIYSEGKSDVYNLSITAGNITVPDGIGVAGSLGVASPQLGDFTINGAGQTGLNTSQVVTSGDFISNPQLRIYQDTTLTSGAGSINLTQGVNNGSKALILGDSNQTGDIFIGGLQVRHLEVGEGAFDLELNGSMHLATNMTAATEFKNTGNLTLYAQGSSFFGGIEALNVSNTFVAGCVATFGQSINLANVTMLPGAPFANRFDTRWTQTHGTTAGGGNITISNFTSSTSKPVEFDIGNGTPNTVNLTGTTNSTNKLYFKGVGNVSFNGDANLSGGVYAQNLVHEQDTTPDLNFDGNVTLTGAMEFEGKSATFANGVEADGNDLTLNFSETTTLDGFNNVANFTSLGAVDLNGTFATSGFQKYEGNVTLTGAMEFEGKSATFANGVEADGNDLTLNFSETTTLDGFNNVANFTSEGAVNLNGTFATTGSQTYNGNVGLAGDSTLSGTTASFSGAIDGGYALLTNGNANFAAPIGGDDALASLTTENGTVGLGGNVSTTGNQTYGGEVTLTGDTTFSSTSGEITLNGLEGSGYNLEFSATSTTLDAAVNDFSNVADLTVSGGADLNGTIATTGNQSYSGASKLIGDTTLTSGAGSINLTQGVNNGSTALILGDSNQTGDIFIGGLQVRHLEVGEGAFDLELNGSMHLATNMTAATEFKNTGNLTLYAQGSSFFGGIEALNVSNTFVAGCVATLGKA